MPRTLTDDLGHAVELPGVVARVVSLVPSLTEALAATCPERLVGATDWCTHPADLPPGGLPGCGAPRTPTSPPWRRCGRTSWSRTRRRTASSTSDGCGTRGIPVWVTDIETVPAAVASMRRLLREVLGAWRPGLAGRGGGGVGGPVRRCRARGGAGLARPVDGGGSADLHRRRAGAGRVRGVDGAGVRALPGGRSRRAGRPAAADLVLLPDEPYVFTRATDRRRSDACRPARCRAGCSPGTALRSSTHGFRWTDPERVMSPSRPGGLRWWRTPQ